MRAEQIALQLYTVRRGLAEDLPGTLDAVRHAGYAAVELAALPDRPVEELARRLADAGLSPIAAHEPFEDLRDEPDRVADRLAALGCPRLVVPALPEADRASTALVQQAADRLNEAAERLAARGIRVGYHNHDHEFAPLDGSTQWAILLDRLGPDVDLEVDIFWASVGGRDPVALIAELGDRVRLLHMKDRRAVAAGEPPRDAPPGAGTLPWQRIIEAGRAAGVEWYVVEQDEPEDPLRDIAAARRHLEGLAA